MRRHYYNMSKVGPFTTGAEHSCNCRARDCSQARQYTNYSTPLISNQKTLQPANSARLCPILFLFQKPSNRNELFSFHGSRGRSAVQCRTMERKWPSISGLAGNCIPVFMGIFRGTQERAAVAYVTESNPTAFIWQLTRQQKKDWHSNNKKKHLNLSLYS